MPDGHDGAPVQADEMHPDDLAERGDRPHGTRLPEHWEVVRFITILRQHAPRLAERYAITTLGVFGSYVRNEQKKGSDLDVLVGFSVPPSLLRLIELEQELSDLLGVKVDLVMIDGLRPAIGRRILAEAVPI